jgi:transcriptional regulator with XRE-family HTH domain
MDGNGLSEIKGNSGAGERLKWLRSEMSASQREFGEPIGFNQAAVSAFEQGKVVLKKPDALAVEHVYGVRHEWLLSGDGPREREATRDASSLGEDEKELLRNYRQMSYQDRETWTRIGRLMARADWDGRSERRGHDRRKGDRREDAREEQRGDRSHDRRSTQRAETPAQTSEPPPSPSENGGRSAGEGAPSRRRRG